jgi:hypothetical protein
MRNRGYIEFETLEKQCWSYIYGINKTAIIFNNNNLTNLSGFAHILYHFLIGKNLAEHWELPNTGIFHSKDVASVLSPFFRIPLLFMELAVGQYTRRGPIGALEKMCPILKGMFPNLVPEHLPHIKGKFHNLVPEHVPHIKGTSFTI